MTDPAGPSEPTELEVRYRRYLAALVLFHQAAADRAGLAPTDYQASNLLDLDGPMTSSELARGLGLSTSATTRCVDRLVRAGMARRTDDPTDRRRAVVEHTGHLPAGLVERLDAVRAPIGSAIGALTDDQRAGLLSYLVAATDAYLAAVAPGADEGRTS